MADSTRIELLRIEEAAEYLNVPTATLRHWRATNYGPPSARLGRRVIYRESDLAAWVNKQFEPTAS